MPFSHLLAMEVSRPWDIALLVTWFEQRKQKNQRKKADNYKICKAKGKAGPSWASSYYSKMKIKTKRGVDITKTCEVCHKHNQLINCLSCPFVTAKSIKSYNSAPFSMTLQPPPYSP
jgi:hypothetical protein